MNIIKITQSQVVDFAADELKKYLMMMMPRENTPEIKHSDCAESGLKLGTLKDLNLSGHIKGNPELDDTIYISTDCNGGIIAGSNERSVLLAVYEFLRCHGCEWIFPGEDGEYIPICDLKEVNCIKTASKRIRGQCNEGSEKQSNMIESIDFAPKIGLNSFMLEFDIPQAYYKHWYRHAGNPYREDETVSNNTVLQWKRQCEAEISKRGLLFHDMGHGWCADAFGIDTTGGWDDRGNKQLYPPAHLKEYFAEIKGERGYFEHAAVNTNICMSNKKARAQVAEYIAEYAEAHSHVSYLHVWLADGSNNHCECSDCIKKDTADWYVILLGEIDEALKKRELDTKIVFIVYADLLWAPIMEKIKNPDRFTMLFAPISRNYMENYGVEPCDDSITSYRRNNLILPKGMGENLAYLKKWQEKFSGDCITYEYHFHWLHYRDPGYISVAKCVYDDIETIGKCNICGMIEDQTQRGFFPSGFPQYVYARKLFDDKVSFEELTEKYFSVTYGKNYKKALEYLNKISSLFDFGYMSDKKKDSWKSSEMYENMQLVPEITEKFRETCEENMCQEIRCAAFSWQLLKLHCDFVDRYSKAVGFKAQGDDTAACRQWQELINFMYEKEKVYQRYFDVFLFWHTTKNVFKSGEIYVETLN